MTHSASPMVNALTVDVEDYFQVSAFERQISRAEWSRFPARVEHNTHRILDLFADHGVKATFFTLGWVAQQFPQLVRTIVAEGHELACHGMAHVRVTEQNPAEFRDDVRLSKALLEDIGGTEILGYRAASYSIGAGNLWALEVLQDSGFAYSSSIYPVHHDLYGMPDAPRFAFRPENAPALLEIPVTTVHIAGRNLPCGGGGYFRLLPYVLWRWGMRHVNQTDRQPGIFYFHPWEIDPHQPRQSGIPLKTRFRHYLNLNRMQSRLKCLLRDFHWNTVANVFASHLTP